MRIQSPRHGRGPEIAVQFNTRIDARLKDRLAAVAFRRGCFERRVVIDALEAYLSKAERKGARAEP